LYEDFEDINIAFVSAMADAMGASDETVSAVYRGAQLLTDVVASLPLEAVDQNGQARRGEFVLLEHPGVDETYHDTLASIMASLIWDGNAYLRPVARDKTGQVTK